MKEQNEEIKKSGHGGRRQGAGRPRSVDAKNSIGFRVPDDIIEILSRQKNRSAFVIAAIRAFDRAQQQGEH